MSAPGLVAGAASYTNGLVAQRSLSACPTAFSRSPCPGTGVILRRPALVGRGSSAILMPVHHTTGLDLQDLHRIAGPAELDSEVVAAGKGIEANLTFVDRNQ